MSDELYHYGVPGMKWGVRRYQNPDGSLNEAGKARQAYEDSKENLSAAVKARKIAKKAQTRAAFTSIGSKGTDKYNKAKSKYNKALRKEANVYADVAVKRANMKAALSKNPEKAEYKSYKRSMKPYGITGSYSDVTSGGKSTAVYNKVKIAKGKAYADRLEKQMKTELYIDLAASALVVLGNAYYNR